MTLAVTLSAVLVPKFRAKTLKHPDSPPLQMPSPFVSLTRSTRSTATRAPVAPVETSNVSFQVFPSESVKVTEKGIVEGGVPEISKWGFTTVLSPAELGAKVMG